MCQYKVISYIMTNALHTFRYFMCTGIVWLIAYLLGSTEGE